VLSGDDPQQLGRLTAEVPAVLGLTPSSWALPCVPPVTASTGGLVVPAAGSRVWMEFEGGDVEYPIWSGVFWGPGDQVPRRPEG
jgi:hypothetical protein